MTTQRATKVEFSSGTLVIHVDDHLVEIPWANCSPKLVLAEPPARREMELSRDGATIRWPQLDEELSVPALLRQHAREASPQARRLSGESPSNVSGQRVKNHL